MEDHCTLVFAWEVAGKTVESLAYNNIQIKSGRVVKAILSSSPARITSWSCPSLSQVQLFDYACSQPTGLSKKKSLSKDLLLQRITMPLRAHWSTMFNFGGKKLLHSLKELLPEICLTSRWIVTIDLVASIHENDQKCDVIIDNYNVKNEKNKTKETPRIGNFGYLFRILRQQPMLFYMACNIPSKISSC